MKETQGRTPLDEVIDAIRKELGEEESGFILGIEATDKLTSLSQILSVEDSHKDPYFVTLMAELAGHNKIDELNDIISTADKLGNLLKEGCEKVLDAIKEEEEK